MSRPLLWTASFHGLVAIACALALCLDAAPITGVHPALKPLKFAVSITAFLLTMGVLLPTLSVHETPRAVLAWLLASTMGIEMVAILVQALRGTTSHFNVRGPFETLIWNAMVAAIAVATIGIVCVVFAALVRPLAGEDGRSLPLLMTIAWRAGLVLLLLAPITGFAMGGRLRHSVGGEDGGAGLPFVNWSVHHGDLRVAHFFALHAVQVLPLVAWLLLHLELASWSRRALLAVAIGAATALSVGTVVQAFAGRPFWARKALMRSLTVRELGEASSSEHESPRGGANVGAAGAGSRACALRREGLDGRGPS